MRAAALLCVGLALAGCQSATPKKDFTPQVARFFLESADSPGTVVTLPQSGVRISIASKPVLTEFDIVNVEVARVELGQCLMFQFTAAAARDLFRLTAANPGRRLVLVLNGAPLGARPIDQPIDRGVLYVFAEVPDAALPALVAGLKQTCAAMQPVAAKR